jgi:hypothetical protein
VFGFEIKPIGKHRVTSPVDITPWTRQAVFVERNIEAGSCNHCCSGKAVSIIILKYYYSDCVFCSLRYPACNAHTPYWHLWPVRLYSIFPRYLIKGKNFGKKEKMLLNVKCVLIFSTTLAETFRILRRTERDIRKSACLSPRKVPVIRVRFEWNLNVLNRV